MSGPDRKPGEALAPRSSGLGSAEFEAVIRRAVELSQRRPDRGETLLSDDEVIRIGSEVGLTREDVREALAELRSGGLRRTGAVRALFQPEVVRAARDISRESGEVAVALDEFMVGGQLLHPVRKSEHRLQYRPAIDWISKVARAASATARRHHVSAAERVEIRLEPTGDGLTFVEIEVDPNVRSEYRGWVAATAIAGGGAIAVGLTILASEALIGAAAAAGIGVAAWAGLTWAVARVAGRAHLKRLSEVQTELEGILDRLEEQGRLEPPPPSWRQWVRRHFHGVSKEIRLPGLPTERGDDGE